MIHKDFFFFSPISPFFSFFSFFSALRRRGVRGAMFGMRGTKSMVPMFFKGCIKMFPYTVDCISFFCFNFFCFLGGGLGKGVGQKSELMTKFKMMGVRVGHNTRSQSKPSKVVREEC